MEPLFTQTELSRVDLEIVQLSSRKFLMKFFEEQKEQAYSVEIHVTKTGYASCFQLIRNYPVLGELRKLIGEHLSIKKKLPIVSSIVLDHPGFEEALSILRRKVREARIQAKKADNGLRSSLPLQPRPVTTLVNGVSID